MADSTVISTEANLGQRSRRKESFSGATEVKRRTTKFFVAQISNLPYRRIPFGRAPEYRRFSQRWKACGLEIRDTAGCNPALRAEGFCLTLEVKAVGSKGLHSPNKPCKYPMNPNAG
jgi:hypothetical protein